MITFENLLPKQITDQLVFLIDHEITNHLCLDVPKYQSFNNMHVKHKDDQYFKLFLHELLSQIKTNISDQLEIDTCWFNVCKQDSQFVFHTHENASNCTCVFFVKNCTGNGTIFQFDNSFLQLQTQDNNLVVFNPTLLHTIPAWQGLDRYTIAVDFIMRN